jgi:hypothetical protein
LDFQEIYTDHAEEDLAKQASRCMDCGVPFCQSDEGCPVYNLIPEWNDLVYKDKWEEAFERLMKTNSLSLDGLYGSTTLLNSLNPVVLPISYPIFLSLLIILFNTFL